MNSLKRHDDPTRRHRLARWCQQLGVTWWLERLPKRDCLIVLNYHRIGQPELAYGDPGVFSASCAAFAQQVEYLKRNFHVVSLHDAIEYARQPKPTNKTLILITFDDGYIDNYQFAYPILKANEVQGTFFLTTSFVGTNRLSWWDALAYMIKNTRAPLLRLDYPHSVVCDLQHEDRNAALRTILNLYKSPENTDSVRFLSGIAEATGVSRIASPDRLFLDWNEAAEMAANGMAIGSHTHTHELVARLDAEQQQAELAESKAILESKLNISIQALAYPVGSKTSFSHITKQALQQTGYQAAFSFYGGINLPGQIDPYDIHRISVDFDTGHPLFRMRTVTASLTGKSYL